MYIHVIHQDGSTTRLPYVRHMEIRELGQQSRFRVFSHRDDVRDADLNRYDDEVEVRKDDGTRVVAGVLRDIKSTGTATELLLGDFETYARDAKPSGGGLNYSGAADTTVIQDALNDVTKLSAGTLNGQKSGLDFVFNHASPAKRIRKAANAAGGELDFKSNKDVDYVGTLGSTRDPTLSPHRGNLDVQSIDRGAADPRVTHLRVIGAGEGEAQKSVDVVASDYNSNIERAKWRVHAEKDITTESTLRDIGETRMEDEKQQRVDIEATVTDVEVNLGDTFHVLYPEEDIDIRLRVPRVEYVNDQEGERWNATFSNTAKTRADPSQELRRDNETQKTSFEGSAVQVSEGPGRGPVGPDSGQEYVMDFYYPDEIEHEYRVELNVKGLNYRAYSGGSKLDSVVSMDLQTGFNVSAGSTQILDSFTMPSDWNARGFVRMVAAYSGTANFYFYFEDSNADTVQEFMHWWSKDATHADITHGDLQAGETYDVLVKNYDGSNNLSLDSQSHGVIYDMSVPTPTITDFDGSGSLSELYPKDCDVVVNNTSLGTSFGDGTSGFQKQIDLSGQLNQGAWNTIEITSAKVGHIDATLSADLYRQVQGQG